MDPRKQPPLYIYESAEAKLADKARLSNLFGRYEPMMFEPATPEFLEIVELFGKLDTNSIRQAAMQTSFELAQFMIDCILHHKRVENSVPLYLLMTAREAKANKDYIKTKVLSLALRENQMHVVEWMQGFYENFTIQGNVIIRTQSTPKNLFYLLARNAFVHKNYIGELAKKINMQYLETCGESKANIMKVGSKLELTTDPRFRELMDRLSD